METFELLEKEIDLEFQKVDVALEFMVPTLLEDVITEESESGEGFFSKLIARLKSIISSIQTKIKNLLTSKKVDNKIQQVKDTVKQNPSMANQKVNMVDYEALEKLNTQTQREIYSMRDSEQIAEKMIKYRQQRNSIIKKGAFITLGLGAALALVINGSKNKIAKLQQDCAESEKRLKELERVHEKMKTKGKETIKNLREENKALQDKVDVLSARTPKEKTVVKMKQKKAKVQTSVGETRDAITTMKQKASAEVEILKNKTTDVLNNIADSVKVCVDPDTKITSKVGTVISTPSKIASTVKSTDTKTNIVRGKKLEMRNELEALSERLKHAKFIINSKDPQVTPDHKRKAKAFIDANAKKFHDLKIAYNALQ